MRVKKLFKSDRPDKTPARSKIQLRRHLVQKLLSTGQASQPACQTKFHFCANKIPLLVPYVQHFTQFYHMFSFYSPIYSQESRISLKVSRLRSKLPLQNPVPVSIIKKPTNHGALGFSTVFTPTHRFQIP